MKCIFVVVLLFGVGFAELQAGEENEKELAESHIENVNTIIADSTADSTSYEVLKSLENAEELNENSKKIEEKSNVDETLKMPKRKQKPIKDRNPKETTVLNKSNNAKPIKNITKNRPKNVKVYRSGMVTLKKILKKAVENGDEIRVERLSAGILHPHPDLLHIAVRNGDVKIATILLKHNVDVDANNIVSKVTPLCKAVLLGNVDMIKLLLKHNANVNAKTIDGLTPLMIAAWSTISHTIKSQIVQILMDHGADINDVENEGRTALHGIAFENNDDVDTAKLLIKFGADVNARKRKLNGTPLHASVRGGNIGITRVLIESGANITAVNSAGDSLLHYAARYDRMELSKILLESGVDVNARNNLNNTPLHIIADLGRIDGAEFAQMLVENGADVTARNVFNLTPYGVAEQKNQLAVAIVLKGQKIRTYYDLDTIEN